MRWRWDEGNGGGDGVKGGVGQVGCDGVRKRQGSVRESGSDGTEMGTGKKAAVE